MRPHSPPHLAPVEKEHCNLTSASTADEAGWVSVDKATTQHTAYPNVFSLGDASSLPNSKTAAAITAQSPVLVHNLAAAARGEKPGAEYDGYASCPLLTGHGELMLCEFKYGGVPKETFANVLGGQEVPNRLFYHLKKDLFVSSSPRWRWTCAGADLPSRSRTGTGSLLGSGTGPRGSQSPCTSRFSL